MILTCPACGTSYVVKDGAIPPSGRQVRCAACKHSWHQDPAGAGESEPTPNAPAADLSPAAEPSMQAPMQEAGSEQSEPASQPVSDVPAVQLAQPGDVAFAGDVPAALGSADEPVPASADHHQAEPAPEPNDVFSSWEHGSMANGQPARARHKGLLTIVGLVVLVAALAAAAWFLAPREWLSRAGLASASNDSPLKLMVTSQDRQKLASGNDLVSLSGRVINPTDSTQAVPALQADLRDGGGTLVYSWTIAPPAPKLPPRGSASFNAAELGVPPQATSLTLRWAS